MSQRRFKSWTKEEDQYLKDNFESKTLYQLAEKLDRTVGGVCCRLSRMRSENKISGYAKKKERRKSKKNWWEKYGPRKQGDKK